MDYRTLAAAALGLLLGGFLLVYPEAALTAQLAGRVPTDSRGEYGSDSAPGRLVTLVRAVGVLLLLAGGYFALSGLGVV